MKAGRLLATFGFATTIAASAEAQAQHRQASRVFFAQPNGPAPSAAVRAARPSAPRAAQTADETAARRHFERGVELAEAYQWAEAAEAFDRSYALLPRPNTLRNLGLAHRAMGRYNRAISELEQFLRDGDPDAETAAEVRRIIAEMRDLLAVVVIHPSVTGAAVMLDDRRVPPGRPVQADPGAHVVTVSAPGYARNVQRINLASRDQRTLEVRLERLGGGGGVVSQWWFWTGLGVLVAGGVAVGFVALSREADPDCGSLNLCVTPR